MKIIIHLMLCTVFVIPIHALASTNHPNIGIIPTENLLGDLVESTSYLTPTEECIANSIDNDCNFSSKVPTEDLNSDEPSIDHPLLDTDTQALTRLQEIDLFRLNPQTELIPDAAPDSTLRQVLFIHRHGDRTPVSFPPKDDLASEPFWSFHGLGQLTNRGKARLFLLGSIIRSRYDKFLNGSVNKNQRISRSSGALRCIESAQTFLSGFLNLNLNGSTDAEKLYWDRTNPLGQMWQPVNVQSVPVGLDGMLAESAPCSQLLVEYTEVIDKSEEVKKLFDKYKDDATVLISTMGFEFDHFYKWFWASSQIEVERSYFPDKIKPQILAVYDHIQTAGNKALGSYQSTIKSRRLRGGLLIKDIIRNMESFQNLHKKVNEDSPDLKKFVHYAAHDLTLIILIGMFDNWDKYPFRPDYASSISIELHEDSAEWFVKILYMPMVPGKLEELHISRCEETHPKKRCTLSKFSTLMRPYMIENWQQWMVECENDLYKLDPYAHE